MKLIVNFQDIPYSFDSKKPIDISLEIRQGESNVNCYYALPVVFETIRSGSFIGDVAAGGVCNHKKVTITPHGNGTHTECYGHISADPEATISRCLQRFLFIAYLITVEPRQQLSGDQVIELAEVKRQLGNNRPEALVIRSLPNDHTKRYEQYSGTNPPYLDSAIGAYLANLAIKHLIIDLPSVDKEVDEGKLAMHKAFWQYPAHIRKDCTITELAYIDNAVPDGLYLVDLQALSMDLDASPSKPVLYKLEKQ